MKKSLSIQKSHDSMYHPGRLDSTRSDSILRRSSIDKVITLLGDAVELLGLRDAPHDDEDILMLRNRLFRRLVETHNYSAIAIESSFPRVDAAIVHAKVLHFVLDYLASIDSTSGHRERYRSASWPGRYSRYGIINPIPVTVLLNILPLRDYSDKSHYVLLLRNIKRSSGI